MSATRPSQEFSTEYLWNNPIRCCIPTYNRMTTVDGGVGAYNVQVTTRDGKQWTLNKTYEEFLALRTTAPNTVCMKFRNRFPLPRPYTRSYMLTDYFLEYRRRRLEKWLHELLTCDAGVENLRLMTVLWPFLEVDEHGGFDGDDTYADECLKPDGLICNGTFRKQSVHLKNWRLRNYIIWSHGIISDYDVTNNAVKNWLDVSKVIVKQSDVVNVVKAMGRCLPEKVQQAIALQVRSLVAFRTLELVFESKQEAIEFCNGLLSVCSNKLESGLESLVLKMTSTNPMKPNGDVTDGVRAAGICPPVAVKNIPEITPPSLNIVMLVVGTRGDVQPFAYFGQALQRRGHRVRLATHEAYRDDVVTKWGLEFFPLGGDPVKLSSYMVQSEGRLLPYSKEEFAGGPGRIKLLVSRSHCLCFALDPTEQYVENSKIDSSD